MGEEVDVIGYETAVDEKYRIYASISFIVLLLGIGVPIWWHTTAVPRVSLPYDGIERLSDLRLEIKTELLVVALSRERAESLARDITEAFRDSDLYRVEVKHRVISSSLMVTAFTHHELEKIASTFDLNVGQLLLLETNNLNDAVLVGSKRTLYFSTDTGIVPSMAGLPFLVGGPLENGNNVLFVSAASTLIGVLSEWMLLEKSLTLTKNALTEPTRYSLDDENRRRFPASPAYDVLITLVNPDPEKLKISWDLHTITEEYVEPFLDELSIFSNFSVKSQWLYYLPLDVNPKRVPDSGPLRRHFALPEGVLPQLITPLEKKLASQVSLHPTISFVIYAVPCDTAPLHIYTRLGHRSKSNANVEAFLSPRWGGVVLINPPVEACVAAKANGSIAAIFPEEATVVGTFLAQLKLLLGIPEPKFLHGVTTVPLVGLKPRDWEVDALLRIRTVEQLTSAKLTLQSLARLLQEIGNIVITDVVGNRIKTALSLVESSTEQLARGDLIEAFLSSKEAFVTAEAAFSDPTLLALLYFPEDQKYAVYIPLFMPALIPILLSLKNIYRYYFGKRTDNASKSK